MKKISFLFIAILAIVFVSCDSTPSFNDGEINVTVTGLDQLTDYTVNSSSIVCRAYTRDGSTYTMVTDASSTFLNYNGTSVTFGIGNPDYVFTGGEVYYIDVLIDIDNDNSLNTSGVDYWLKYYEEVAVDGVMNISVDNTDFILRQ